MGFRVEGARGKVGKGTRMEGRGELQSGCKKSKKGRKEGRKKKKCIYRKVTKI